MYIKILIMPFVCGIIVINTCVVLANDDTIRNSWRDNELKAKYITVVVRHKKYEKKGSISASLSQHIKEQYKILSDIPPQDEEINTRSTLFLSESKFKFETTKREWSLRRSEYYDEPYVSIFDGKLGRVFHGNSQPDNKTGDGSLRPRSRFYDFTLPEVFPIMVNFRGANPTIGFDLTTATISREPVLVRGKKCLSVLYSPKNGKSSVVLFLDPGLKCALIRYQILSKNKPVVSLDVLETSMTPFGPLPTKWITNRTGEADYLTSTLSEVESYDFEANMTNDDFFSLHFPKGTIVVDTRNDRVATATGDPYQFIDYGDRPFFRRHRTLIFGTLFLIFIGLFTIRRMRRKIYCQ